MTVTSQHPQAHSLLERIRRNPLSGVAIAVCAVPGSITHQQFPPQPTAYLSKQETPPHPQNDLAQS